MVKRLLVLNLLLQCFDGLLSYQAFSLGAAEANPFVSAAIANWGVTYGLLYKKTFASLCCSSYSHLGTVYHRLPGED